MKAIVYKVEKKIYNCHKFKKLAHAIVTERRLMFHASLKFVDCV